MSKEYKCVTLHKEDLLIAKFRKDLVAKLSDDNMEWLARKIGDACTEQAFWTALNIFGDVLLAEIAENGLTKE